MLKIKQHIYVGVLVILIASNFSHAATKIAAEEMLKPAKKKSATQLVVEDMLKNNQGGCDKDLENNEFKKKLEQIPAKDRFFEELTSTYKRTKYNLYDIKTGEFVIGITYFPGPICPGFILHGIQHKRIERRRLK